MFGSTRTVLLECSPNLVVLRAGPQIKQDIRDAVKKKIAACRHTMHSVAYWCYVTTVFIDLILLILFGCGVIVCNNNLCGELWKLCWYFTEAELKGSRLCSNFFFYPVRCSWEFNELVSFSVIVEKQLWSSIVHLIPKIETKYLRSTICFPNFLLHKHLHI